MVGSSGSGNSTIAQLLGVYQPQGGTVLLDDTDLHYLILG
jgi:ABC-type bacteriocin/lantibiotic exporter with double-glycine peptidase domain